MPRTVRSIALISLVLAILACGLPVRSAGPASSQTDGGLPTASPEPEPLPASMSQAVSAGVRAGLWPEAEGLVSALRYLAGELSAEEVFGDQPLMSAEGTRVVRRAQIYLEDPAHTEGRDEMTRLLAILVPSRETLDRFSQPASAAVGGPGLARSAERPVGDSTSCRSLWSTGFEDADPVVCLEYAEVIVGGIAHRVYYPAYWEDDAPERALLEPTRDALELSLETFNTYGPNPVAGTDIVFTDLPAIDEGRERDDVLAAADRILRAERCHVAVFPSGTYLALRDEASGEGDDYGVLLQTIAHELFHCYQFSNLAPQESGPEGDAADWWIEGSAEYFGSVVYPSVNAEFEFLDELDAISPGSSLIFYSYPAYAFFQYLDVQGDLSPQDVIGILRRMPPSGGYDEQQAAVAGLDGMAEAFHAFGQTYLDKQLEDLGGGTLQVHPAQGEAANFPIGPGEAQFTLYPLVLHRYRLTFAEQARFTVSKESQGVTRNSARPASAPGAWSEIPPEVNTACGDSEYVLLATSVVPPGAEEAILHLRTVGEQVDEEQPCDECVVGTWELDNASYLAHMGGLWPIVVADMSMFGLSTEGAEVHPTGVSGSMRLTFEADGNASGVQEGWGIAGEGTKDGVAVHARMIYNGVGEAAWKIQTDERTREEYLFFEGGSFGLTAQMIFEGFPLAARPTGGSNDTIFLSSPQPFLCNATTLTYNPDDPLGPIVFIRVAPESSAP